MSQGYAGMALDRARAAAPTRRCLEARTPARFFLRHWRPLTRANRGIFLSCGGDGRPRIALAATALVGKKRQFTYG
jgi:hypothetical protein